MDFTSGARVTTSDTDRHILDLEKGLDFLNARQDGVALMKKIGLNAPAVKSWKHEWTETALANRYETVTLATGATTLTVADAYQYTVGELLAIEDEVVRVTAIASATTLTIVRAQAGTSDPGTNYTSVRATRIGTALRENSTAENAVSDGTNRLYNYVQTFDRPVELSTHEITSLQTGKGNPMKGQVKRRYIEVVQQLAGAFIYGTRSTDGTDRHFAGGLKQFVTTNVTDASSAAVSVDLIDDIVEAQVLAGAYPNVMAVHPTQKRKLDALDANLVRIGKREKRAGNPNVSTWQSGVLDGDLEIVVDHTLAPDELWILDTGKVGVHKMSNNGAGHGFKMIDATDNGQDGRKTRILGHYTFTVKTEKAHGYLHSLATA